MTSKISGFSGVKKYQSAIILLLVGLIVSIGCLKADFYMDDYLFIVKGDYASRPQWVTNFLGMQFGDATPGADVRPITMLLTSLVFSHTYDIFGPSSVAFHVLNLISHLTLGLLALVTLQKFLTVSKMVDSAEEASRIAFWGALIFLVHPLCTEPVNYAKCFYMQLVGISSALTCYFTLSFIESMRLKHLLGIVGSLGFALISYGYGFPIALGQFMILFVFLAPRMGDWLKVLRNNRVALALVVCASLFLAFHLISIAIWHISYIDGLEFSYTSHILTQGRVFWEYISRMILPKSLCSDHLVAWSTTWADAEAVMKLCFAFLMLMAATGLAWFKRRTLLGGVALVVLLISVPLLVRWPYPTHEVMVEYRTYPAMIWVGVSFALLLSGLAHWMTKRPGARMRNVAKLQLTLGSGVAIIFGCLTMQRSVIWRSFGDLAQDVIDKYPLNIRAYSNLQYTTYLGGEYQETLVLHKEMTNQFNEMRRLNTVDPLRRQYDVAWSEKAYLTGEGLCGLAIANLEGAKSGITYIEKRIEQLQASRPDLFEQPDPKRAAGITPLMLNLDALKENAEKIEANRSKRSDILKEAAQSING